MTQDPGQFQKVEEVFHLVRRLPRAQWTAALDEHCGQDKELRYEVESLLNHAHPHSQHLHLTRSLQAYVVETSHDEIIGQRIGPYEIQRWIGGGGMGNVYVATQTEPVRRTVALKIIKRGMDTDETIRRFKNERQLLAGLSHPQIAQLLEGGSTQDGLPYFVMQYVEGEPITAYAERRQLSIPEKLKLFQQVCAAVHFAHQNTVIHRDLKPANILVTPDGTPTLLDFGIAKLTNREQSLATGDYTIQEHRFLTPDYASPEQIRGERVTTASDVYSLGIILCELLTGLRPYDLTGCSRSEVAGVVCSDREPPRASSLLQRPGGSTGRGLGGQRRKAQDADPAAGEQLRRQLRGDLDNIVLTALQRDPAARYQSVEQLSADIQRHLDHEPVLAAPPSTIYRLNKFARRNKAVCAVAAALILGMLGSTIGVVVAIRSRNGARMAERAALISERHANDQTGQLRRAVYVRELSLASADIRNNEVGSAKRRLQSVPEALRGWEWKYLFNSTDTSHQTWYGHEGEVTAVAFSPDGARVVSASADKTLRIWKFSTGELLGVLRGHEQSITSAVFSPDGLSIASASKDGTVRIWNSESLTCATFRISNKPVYSVRFRPDGKVIAAALFEDNIKLLDARSGVVLRECQGFHGAFDSLAFSPDGTMLAGAGGSDRVKVWDPQTGGMIRDITGFQGTVCSLAFSRDGSRLAAGILETGFAIWNTHDWKFRLRRSQAQTCCPVAFTPDGNSILTSLRSASLLERVIAGTANTYSRLRQGHDATILSVAVSPDGDWIVTGSADQTLKVWDRHFVESDGRSIRHGVRGISFSPDGRLMLSTFINGMLDIWDADSCHYLHTLDVSGEFLWCSVFAPDGRSFAAGSYDGKLCIWNAGTGWLRRVDRVCSSLITALAYAPDSKRIVVGGQNSSLILYDLDRSSQILCFKGHREAVQTVLVAPNGQWMASGGMDGTVRIWSMNSGAELHTFAAHAGTVRGLAINADGSRLVSCGDDKAIRVWNPVDGSLVHAFMGHTAAVTNVAYSHDNTRIASVAQEPSIRLWDATNNSEILAMSSEASNWNCIAFSPDDKNLVAGNAETGVLFKKTEPFSVRIERRSERGNLVKQQEAMLDGLRDGFRSWNNVVEDVLADTSSPEYLKRAALNRILAGTSKHQPLGCTWDVAFYSWQLRTVRDAREPSCDTALRDQPIARMELPYIDLYCDKRPPAKGVPAEHFAMQAITRVVTPSGKVRITTISENGLRLYIDGKKLRDRWSSDQAYWDHFDLDLAEGEHTLRIDYFHSDGKARIGFFMDALPPKPAASSPGSTPAPDSGPETQATQ